MVITCFSIVSVNYYVRYHSITQWLTTVHVSIMYFSLFTSLWVNRVVLLVLAELTHSSASRGHPPADQPRFIQMAVTELRERVKRCTSPFVSLQPQPISQNKSPGQTQSQCERVLPKDMDASSVKNGSHNQSTIRFIRL